MSEERHTRDIENKLDHHTAGGTEGGKCLNRHESRKPNNSCSHIWQATKKAQSDDGLYNWPRYKDMPGTIQVFFQGREAEAGKPQKGDWDVKAGNFDTHCDVPYFHEAHHVIPNSTLSTTISDYLGNPDEGGSPELVTVVRGGLLTAGYNLNHMDNMIMLPLDATVARVMRLPRHRTLPKMYHGVYSDHVKSELKAMLADNLEDLVDHEAPKYKDFKDKLIALSNRLYGSIKQAGEDGVDALDHMAKELFKQQSAS
ncbi:AHH domain-containing protein [Myxococcus sp. CA056]|uniref:AHH domain-containing protein n=1 Tax=unclassified Myxococcus TaxID=2648731 RepID=UPI00157B0C3F|nr:MULTISPECIES: AHH domain-containing protein [unclassified Myxococcus]NTX13033.1 AHH domain-containing protein [Myxococcus sp. CA056]NTX36516.1 AHH domain-containing protein [Myxococcus sp. CA033]